MDQVITLQAQATTAQVEQQGVPKENPSFSTMATRLRDFTRVNPPVYTGSKIVEDLMEGCRASMMNGSMDLSMLMVHVQQMEESRKRKHTRERIGQGKLRRFFQGRVVLKLGISTG